MLLGLLGGPALYSCTALPTPLGEDPRRHTRIQCQAIRHPVLSNNRKNCDFIRKFNTRFRVDLCDRYWFLRPKTKAQQNNIVLKLKKSSSKIKPSLFSY